MSAVEGKTPVASDADVRLEQATEWFLRVGSESVTEEDLQDLQRWMQGDARNALAYRQVSASWDAVGAHAAAPEIVMGRRDALADASRTARHRWSSKRRLPRYSFIAASIVIVLVGAFAWLQSQRGLYATDLGERRTLTLEDGSVIALDARSRIRVRYRANERLIALEQGQARFNVARDVARPFRVRARDQSVVALGTQFNVELVGGTVLVTMIEGHVAVTGVESPIADPARAPGVAATAKQSVELRAGEGLRVQEGGQVTRLAAVDVEHAVAWQTGKMFFDNEPLASAAERVNRYARQRIEVDPSVAQVRVSGIFNAGDSAAFIEAVTEYFPVEVHPEGDSEIRLRARQ